MCMERKSKGIVMNRQHACYTNMLIYHANGKPVNMLTLAEHISILGS